MDNWLVYSRYDFPSDNWALNPAVRVLATPAVKVPLWYLLHIDQLWISCASLANPATVVLHRWHSWVDYWLLFCLGNLHHTFEYYESQRSWRRLPGQLQLNFFKFCYEVCGVFSNRFWLSNFGRQSRETMVSYVASGTFWCSLSSNSEVSMLGIRAFVR